MKKEEKKILSPAETVWGGGTLSKKEQPDGLKKFIKNGKQKNIVISAIIGLILLVGGITLYRTFALYEEKKEFNVLRGRVPNFGDYDIKLAFTINGEPQKEIGFPTKNSGYGVESVECKSGVTAGWNSSFWGLVNINSNSNSKIECTINFADTVLLYDNVKIGDYISYTPEKTSYKITQNLTGYIKEQIIKPSELNLWRVIRKNTNGTIEIVSEYVSSKEVYFYGGNGYVNFIGGLNTIASSYETEEITSGSRHMGYSNQIEVCASLSNCSGDTAYISDTNLVTSAIGFLEAMPINKNTNAAYWIASRYIYAGDNNYRGGRFIGNDGKINNAYYDLVVIGISEAARNRGIRPIVSLKSGITGVKGTYNNKNLWKVN